MATFWQWRFPHEFELVDDPLKPGKRKRQIGALKPYEVARVTWLCGRERVLVEEVVDCVITSLSKLTTLDRQTFTIGSDKPRDVWSALNQRQVAASVTSLVILRNADQVSNWVPLIDWINNRGTTPNNNLLLISDGEDFPYKDPVKVDGKMTYPLQDHVRLVQQRGDVIKCAMPGEDNGDAIVEWVLDKKEMPTDVAQYLITRLGGELRDIRDVCLKLAALPGIPGREVIDALCPVKPADSFVDSLCLLDKPNALAALLQLPPDEWGRAIALLDASLTRLSRLNEQVRKNLSARDIAIQDDKAQQMYFAKFRAVAKYYDPVRATKSRRALALIDAVSRRGIWSNDGLMESLVALW